MLRSMKLFRIVLLLLVGIAAGYLLLPLDDSGDGSPAVPTLHRGLVTDPESVDPQKARSTQAAEVLRDIGEGLVGY